MSLDNENVFSLTGFLGNEGLESTGGEESAFLEPSAFTEVKEGNCDAFVDIQSSLIYRDSGTANDEVFFSEDVLEGVEWYRIPINGIEQWINKDGPAAINRTTKVTAFNDTLLDKIDFRQLYINSRNFSTYLVGSESQFDGTPMTLDRYFDKMLVNKDRAHNRSSFVRARVWMYDKELDEYTLTQHGYVGGYGPTDNPLLRKFWIYDTADLLRDIPVGKTFENATLSELIRFVVSGTDDAGNDVGIEKKTPFDVVSIDFPSEEELSSRTLGELLGEDENIDGILDFAEEFLIGLVRGEQLADRIRGAPKRSKSFARNRNNMVDVLNYIATLIDGIWYIAPRPDGIALQIRADWSTNNYGREFTDQTQDSSDTQFNVTVLENTALSDIKPINTIQVNGKSKSRLGKFIEDPSRTALEVDSIGERYPYAKLRYDPLYEAAGQQELGPTNKKSDATDLNGAERDAYKEFIEHVEESTEGSITLVGDPMPLPYDYIDAAPACLGNIVQQQPIEYSINDVHHKKYAGEQFITELGVHAKIIGDPIDGDGSNFTINSEYRQAQ